MVLRYITSCASYFIKKTAADVLRHPLLIRNRLYKSFIQKRSVKKALLREEHRGKFGMIPESVEVELTNHCNVKCVFCPQPTHRRERMFMDPALFEKIVLECKSAGINRVILSGIGEMTMDKDLVNKMVFLRTQLPEAFVILITNGTLLREGLSQTICAQGLVDEISISIDASDRRSYEETHGVDAWEKIYRNLETLKKCMDGKPRPTVTVRFKIDLSNSFMSFWRFLVKFSTVADHIVPFANIFHWPTSGIGHTEPGIPVVCPGLWGGIYVHSRGDVVLCGMDYEDSVVLGNVRDDSMVALWNGPIITEVRRQHLQCSGDNFPLCADCQMNTHLIWPLG